MNPHHHLSSIGPLLKRAFLLAGCVSITLIPNLLRAQVSSTWIGGSGFWSNPANWSPNSFYPNNGNGGNIFDVTVTSGSLAISGEAITIRNLTFSGGSISIPGASSLPLTITGHMSFSNSASIESGGGAYPQSTLILGASSTFSVPADNTVTFAGNLINQGTATISGTISKGAGNITNSGTMNLNGLISDNFGTLTFSNTGTLSLGNGASIYVNNSGIGASGFINTGLIQKNGAGLATMNVNTAGTFSNSSSGVIDVSTGTFNFNGQAVSNAGILRGSGTFMGSSPIIVSGGRISPGNGAGTLTFASGLTLNTGSILNFELGTVSDLINVSGGILTGPSGTGGVTLNLSALGGFGAGNYNLITGTSFSDFQATDFILGSIPGGFDYALSFTGTALQLSVTTSAIPEPSTYALLVGLAMLGAGWEARRRRQRRHKTSV